MIRPCLLDGGENVRKNAGGNEDLRSAQKSIISKLVTEPSASSHCLGRQWPRRLSNGSKCSFLGCSQDSIQKHVEIDLLSQREKMWKRIEVALLREAQKERTKSNEGCEKREKTREKENCLSLIRFATFSPFRVRASHALDRKGLEMLQLLI